MLNLTFVKTAILTGLLALAGGTTAVTTANTADTAVQENTALVWQQDEDPDAPAFEAEQDGPFRDAFEYFRDSVKEVTAETLGITVEELETARENRALRDLLDETGVQREDIKTAIDAAWPEIVQGAEAEGLITSEQADRLLENGFRLPRRHGRGGQLAPEQIEQAKSVVADVLGITVEELEQAQADGQRLPDLIEELGLDEDDVRAQLETARNEALQQAVEEGRLTEEQAERLQNRPLRGRGGPHNG